MISITILLKRTNAELFTDTDSLVYEIKSKNIYENLFNWKDLFDFSNYFEDSEFYNKANKRIIGKMKDEFKEVIATESIGLKSKMYSIKKINGKETNTAKGVNLQQNLMNLKMFYLRKKL